MKTPRHIAIEDAAGDALTQMEQASKLFANDPQWNAALTALQAAFALKSKPLKVWVLVTESDQGIHSEVHATRAGAEAALYDYVKEGWDEDEMGGPIPSNRKEAVEAYFNRDEGDDRAEITPCEVED